MHYYVVEKGIYIQGIIYIGDSKEKAIETAIQCALDDVDSYHDWIAFQYCDVEDIELLNVNKDQAKEKYSTSNGGAE